MTAKVDTKPVPIPTIETQPYWQGCNEGRLLIQHCKPCGRFQFYPRLVCTQCAAIALDWVDASGRGTVRSFTVIRRAVSPAFEADVPYVVALIQLDEGPTMMANLIACDPEVVVIGLKVAVTFERRSAHLMLPQFLPA